MLLMNGYPDHVIEKTIAYKFKTFTSPTLHTVKKCPVYLHLLWLGAPSVGVENKIKASVEKRFFAVEQHVIFKSRPFLRCCSEDFRFFTTATKNFLFFSILDRGRSFFHLSAL